MNKEILSLVGGTASVVLGSVAAANGMMFVGWGIFIIGMAMALVIGDVAGKEGKAEWERKRQEYLDSERR